MKNLQNALQGFPFGSELDNVMELVIWSQHNMFQYHMDHPVIYLSQYFSSHCRSSCLTTRPTCSWPTWRRSGPTSSRTTSPSQSSWPTARQSSTLSRSRTREAIQCCRDVLVSDVRFHNSGLWSCVGQFWGQNHVWNLKDRFRELHFLFLFRPSSAEVAAE